MIATEYCKKVFDGTHDSPKPVENGRLLITSKHIANRSLDISSAYLISEEDFENVNKRSQVHQWDILFSMIGTVGNVYIETSEKIDYAIKNMGVFSCQNKEKAYWLYYYLQSPLVQAKIDALMAGAVQKFVPLGFLRDLDIPEYTENSKKVVQVLSALDNKIALNKKMNQKLERIAKRLYDYWFVQYDFPDKNGHPYKTTGGLMTYNPTLKREVPEGWEVKKLEDCINLFDSKRVPLSSQQRASKKGMIPYYGATGIMDYIDDFIYDGEYILLAEDGSVETDEGFVIIQRIWGKTWVNNHAHVIQPKEKGQYEFYFQVLSSIVAKKITTGSIQKKISQENMNAYKLLAPPKDLILKYCLFVHNSWEKQKKIADENIKLQNLRDNLLPLLMNGQVTVA